MFINIILIQLSYQNFHISYNHNIYIFNKVSNSEKLSFLEISLFYVIVNKNLLTNIMLIIRLYWKSQHKLMSWKSNNKVNINKYRHLNTIIIM